jgi:hypothetical protein
VRVKEEESQEIGEMKQARCSWDGVPARVREEPGICRGTLYADDVGRGHNFGELTNDVLWWKCDIWQALVRREGAMASQPSTAGYQRSALSFVVKSGIANIDLVRLT